MVGLGARGGAGSGFVDRPRRRIIVSERRNGLVLGVRTACANVLLRAG